MEEGRDDEKTYISRPDTDCLLLIPMLPGSGGQMKTPMAC